MKQRLVIFTGKGGVGKTTLALAYAKILKNRNLKVKYTSFYQTPDEELVFKVGIPLFNITVLESAEIYIGNKLGSKTIASWIMATHFFKSLFQMIPGLGHMILLGHILKELEADPNLIIVLDSPASGHAMTMFESSNNFKRIFKTGLIVNDIEKMKLQLEDPDFLKSYIVALPNELAIQESRELLEELSPVYKNLEIIINNSLKKYCELSHIEESDLPQFLKEKIENEKEVLNGFPVLPHIPENNFAKTVKELELTLSELV
jgi:arsenite-transporting ATPase